MTTLELQIFGIPMRVEMPQARAESVLAQWAWCLPDSPAQRSIAAIGGHPLVPEVTTDPALVHRPDLDDDVDGHDADYRLTTTLTGAAIAACSGQLLMFHAAGVAELGSHRVAGLIAPSGTGKTTAARTLCTSGLFGYVTDETLVLNDAGAVMPYPKPLSVVISEDDSTLAATSSKPEEPTEPGVRHKSQHGPDELGFLPPPPGALTLGPVVVLNRLSSESPARLTPLPVIEGLKAVLPQSSAVPLIPNCLDMIAELARRGGGFHQLTYSEISEAPSELLRAFAAEPTPRDWVHVPGTWLTGPDAPPRYGHVPDAPPQDRLTPSSRVRRAPFVDAILTEDLSEALVLLGDRPLHLRGIGAQSWQFLSSPHSVEEVLAHCVEVFGEHPDAPALIDDALRQLEISGVIARITQRGAEPGRSTDR